MARVLLRVAIRDCATGSPYGVLALGVVRIGHAGQVWLHRVGGAEAVLDGQAHEDDVAHGPAPADAENPPEREADTEDHGVQHTQGWVMDGDVVRLSTELIDSCEFSH